MVNINSKVDGIDVVNGRPENLTRIPQSERVRLVSFAASFVEARIAFQMKCAIFAQGLNRLYTHKLVKQLSASQRNAAIKNDGSELYARALPLNWTAQKEIKLSIRLNEVVF